MPKLWTDTIEAHKQSVHDAVLDAAAALLAEAGLGAVSMSAIAARSGIGRATLYKYFPDVEVILGAWHQRQVARHLAELHAVAARTGDPAERLRHVLEAYLRNAFGSRGHLAALPHVGAHVEHAQAHLREFLSGLIAKAAVSGAVRSDIAADELAAFCLAALGSAEVLTAKAARGRLLALTLEAIAPR
jgi:AcrR family transcriptional regulator